MEGAAHKLKATAREIFIEALHGVDARRAVRAAVHRAGRRLMVVDCEFELNTYANVCAIAIGKAGRAMAAALSDVLGARLARSIVSAPVSNVALPAQWQAFAGGQRVLCWRRRTRRIRSFCF